MRCTRRYWSRYAIRHCRAAWATVAGELDHWAAGKLAKLYRKSLTGTNFMDVEQQETARLRRRQSSIRNAMQNCWLGVIITSCCDAVFHFRFGEPWFFVPMMFFLFLLLPMLAYCYITQGMVKAKLKSIKGRIDPDSARWRA